MMVTTAKLKNASPNTGSRCKSGRNGGWLQPTRASAWLRRICLLVLATLVFIPLVLQRAWFDNNRQYRKKITMDFSKVGVIPLTAFVRKG